MATDDEVRRYAESAYEMALEDDPTTDRTSFIEGFFSGWVARG